MEEPQEVFYLASLEDLRTVADILRVRLMEHLVRQPLTVKQLAELVRETPAKIHYHVHELERIGVVRLVETREKGGVLEKYYRAVAKNITVSPDLLRSSPPSDLAAMVNDFFQMVSSEALKAMDQNIEHSDHPAPFTLGQEVLWATSEEFRTVMQHVSATLTAYSNPRGVEGEKEWVFSVIGHQMVTTPSAATPSAVAPVATPRAVAAPQKSQRTIMVIVGDIHLTRGDLEKALADGKPYDITLLGRCRIDDDVPVDLAERAILRFHHIGVLIAAPEVREAVAQKGHGIVIS